MPKLNNSFSSFITIPALAGFFLFTPCFVFASTTVSGAISENTTWTQAQGPYIVQYGISINQGVTLTIDPGVVIKFQSNFIPFLVDGTLAVNGTAADKVYFTSYQDDSVGGDTNADGTATSPSSQDWADIRFNPGSVGTITNAVIRYGGSYACRASGCTGSQSAVYNNGGTLAISDSQFSQNNLCGILQINGSAQISNSEIDHHTYGFFLGYGTSANISNSNFHDNTYGVTSSSGGALTLINNTFVNNVLGAASVDGLVDFTHAGNTASGNGRKVFVMSGSIGSDTQWNNDVPYLISSVTVDAGKTLIIDPGVIIKFENLNSLLEINGTLKINGTKTNPVFLTSINDDAAGGDTNGDGAGTDPIHGDWRDLRFNAGSTGAISYAIIRYAGGLNQVYSAGSFAGVYNNGGSVNISHSEIDHNGSFSTFIGIRQDSGDLTITDSSIHDNPTYGIGNSSLGNPIKAINNWWGDGTGPYHPLLNAQARGNPVSDNVNFMPWLGYDPTTQSAPGNSSVVFLPGFEGSRLYEQGAFFENRLWEPNRNDDVHKLYFNSDGTPRYNDIYTRDDIDEVYGALNNIYVGFNDSMKKLVDERVINEFKILPYDWRLSLDDILTSGKVVGMDGAHANLFYTEATSSPYIIQKIERLARNSATGKTTLVAHSNGGLLAKRLMKKLEEKGEANIIDKIIFVAVPQSGTPQAVAALLHGHDQAYGFGFVLTQSNARTFAENMPAGYNLLPHQKYFADVLTPVVTFDPTALATQSFRNFYGTTIDNQAELSQFLLGAEGRQKPDASNTDNPNVLNRTLLDHSLKIQDELDAWMPPEGIEVIQIAGWGTNTLSGITYTEKDNTSCLDFNNCSQKFLDYKPEFVVDGDGTVVIPSAFAMGTSTVRSYYMDLSKYNGDYLINRKHESILEVPFLQEFIKNLVENKSDIFPYISSKEFILVGNRLRFAVHSLISLDLYDSFGNHTGISATTHSGGDMQLIDEQIPNSYYMDFGEGKYAGADGVGTTTVNLLGKGLGVFTFDIEETRGNIVVASTTFAEIPVTASTTAIMDILNLSSSSVPILRMDIDGDGITDANISSGAGISPEELLGVLRGVIKTINLPQKKEKKLVKAIDKLDRALEKEDKNVHKDKHRTKQAFSVLEDIILRFQKKNLLTKDEADELINIIEQIKGKVIQ